MPNLGDLTVSFAADLSKLSSGIVEAKVQISSVAATAEQTSTSFLGHLGKMGGSLLDFGSKIGQTVFGLQGLYQGAVSLGQAFLGPNASMEQTDVAFETLLGKGKATQDFLGQLQQFAAATPFEFPELATDAEHMLAFGFSAKSVIPSLTNIGDAMGSMGKSNADIDHMVEIFGQMHAAGKLNAGDMMQISQEGIPAWKMLADAMGKTVPEVQKLSSQGLIPADTAIKAVSDGMHKMFGGGMAAQAQTFNGLLSTLQDNASQAFRAFSGPLFTAAKGGLTDLGNLVSSPKFQAFAKELGQDVSASLGKAGTAIQQAGKFLSTTLLPPLEHLGHALEPIVKPIADWAAKNDVLGKSMSGVSTIVGALVTGLGHLIDDVASVVDLFTQNQVAADLLVGIMAGLTAGVIAFNIQAIIAAVTAIPGAVLGFGAWAIAAGAAAIATLAATWPILLIAAIIGLVVVGIILAVQHWGDIMKWLQGVAGAVAGAVGGFFSGLGSAIHGIIDGIGKAFSGLGSLVHSVWDGIVGSIKGAINAIIGGIDQFISAVNGIHIDIPHIDAGPIHIGGGRIGLPQIPLIPKLASGVENFQGGMAYVHKDELLTYLPSGTNVSRAGSFGSGDIHVHNHIYLDGREVTNQVMTRAMKEIRRNGGRAA